MKKKITVVVALLCLCVVMAACFIGCSPKAVTKNGDYAYSVLKDLNYGLYNRIANTQGEQIAAEYISNQFKSFGYKVDIQNFEYTLSSKKTTQYYDEVTKEIKTKTTRVPVDANSNNVYVLKKGKDSSKTVVVGAHYDCVGAGKGIDDNGSGVAVMLETAKYFATKEVPNDIIFVAFAAEEVGCIGSKEFVKKLEAEDTLKNVKYMINLDSLAGGDKTYVYGGADDTSKAMLADVLKFGKDSDLKLITNPGYDPNEEEKGIQDKFYGLTGDWSDHSNFKKQNIPFLYFEATDWEIGYNTGETQVDGEFVDYEIMHTPYDNLDFLNAMFPGKVQSNLSTYVNTLIHVIG